MAFITRQKYISLSYANTKMLLVVFTLVVKSGPSCVHTGFLSVLAVRENIWIYNKKTVWRRNKL